MTRHTNVRGVIAAIPTPFTPSGEVDARAYIEFAEYLLDEGCDALNMMGTTGEATSLSVEERVRLMEAVAASKLPMNRLIVGTGASSVVDAVALSVAARRNGFAGALVLPPFYYKNVPDEGVRDYLSRIIDATPDLPIYLYNFPALSGVPYHIDLISELLAKHGTRIAGLKDSSNDIAYCEAAAALSSSLDVFSGSEEHLLHRGPVPLAGCISATVNVNANLCATAYANRDEVLLRRAVGLRKAFDGIQLVSGVKFVVSRVRHHVPWEEPRPPLRPASAEERVTLADRMARELVL